MPPPPPPDVTKVSQPPDASPKKPKYDTGILVWAKMTGHPWWPCMITDDPLEKVHTKLNGRSNY